MSKYIASFDYFDESFIVLSAASGSISVALFATVIGAPVRIAGACSSLAFSNVYRIIKKLFKTTTNKKKKHGKVVMWTRNNLNRIESKVSEVLRNNEISHEDFITIIN